MNQNEETSENLNLQLTDSVKLNETGFVFEINEIACFYAVWAFFFALYGLKVNDFNLTNHLPPVFGFLQVFGDAFTCLGYNLIFFCLASTGVVAGLLFGLRAVLPEHLKQYLCWRLPVGFQFEQKKESAWPAVLTVLVCLTSVAVLFFAVSHLRADRSHRRPVISWEGPAADYIDWVFVLGWTFAYLTVFSAAFTDTYFTSRWNWLVKVATGLLGLLIAAAFILTCAVLED
ncbi:hypothetical protein [uncultured Gimesia sp.]|jgi:hypothetical protein|uniref:hypothetical protein n=1 Tax=uncultured Gimesia sp. TaxID=1678688 RepID=UPI002612C987|nr:hypothetical protein [uncultured Gimesia sp.]